MKNRSTTPVSLLLTIVVGLLMAASLYAQGGHPPDHEVAYFNGQTFNTAAMDWLPQRVPAKSQGNVFVVVYPIGWEDLGLAAPQCDPCDHAGNGITFDDFHDHVLDSIPSSTGWRPMKHVNVILPNYSFLAGVIDPTRDAAVSAAYASRLPVTSVDAVNDLLSLTAPDGSPLAIRLDPGFYLHVSVLGPH
jgi:hypothetical protein